MDDETLQFPAKIAEKIGLATNEINAMKRLGCPFYGRKTCVAWVRAWLAQQAGHAQKESQSVPALIERHQHSAVSTHHG